MRSLFSSISFLVSAVLILSSCSPKNVAQTEVDDMYFTSKDRQVLEASTKVYDENFVENYEKPLTQEEVDEYAEVNYSSKTVNPEYIAKYSSEELTEDQPTEVEGEYFDETYNNPVTESGKYDNYKVVNNYYGTGPSYSYGNPYNSYSVWNYDPWFYTSPYRYNPYPYYGSGLTVSIGFGYSSGYYNPYRYNRYGFYDPYYYGYNSRWYNDPWGYYGGSYYNNYGYNGYYCPTYYAPTYFITDNGSYGARAVTRGPRVARGATTNSGSNNNQYRSTGTGDGIRITDDGSVASRDNSNVNSRTSTGSRNNYYRRSGTSNTNVASTRSYQGQNRTSSSKGITTSSSSSRRTATSGYTRSSQSSYRTNSGNTTRNATGVSSSGTTSRSYRSTSGTNYNRSRSTPSYNNSRSSGATRSISSGSSSGGSRSSGSSSGGSSRGSSSSSGGSRRGGN